MEVDQELEWKAAQSTAISVQLVPAAKRHLKFLATVDRHRWLYETPGLERAIYRLNPVRYKSDCEEFYERILDNENVVSSLNGRSGSETERVWKMLYSGEPYELDFNSALQDNVYAKKGDEKCTKYDLISAVQRQTPFCYQVSTAHMNDDRYLEGSVARYKGFLHLINRNTERSIQSFSVPTYDIDLIWHTHQLHPESYCKDLLEIMGKVLNHDDTDSDRTKRQKLDVGFSTTTKTFEEMYGSRYWRAGAISSKKLMGNKGCNRRQVIGTTAAGETRTLAESLDSEWSMVNSLWFLQLPSSNSDGGHILQLTGPHTVRLFPGRKLDYQSSKCFEKHKCEFEMERHLITAIEFSADDPYGRAVALLDLKSGTVKVKEEWFLLPCLILALVLSKE